MVLEFERAKRMRDPLQRVRDRMRVVVQRIDAPLVAGAVVRRVPDPIDRRIAQVDVRAGQVDFQAQHVRAVGKLAFLHPAEQIEVLGYAAVAVARGLARARSACPRSARISSGLELSTYAMPALIRWRANSYRRSK